MHLWKSHPAHEQAHGVEKNTLILFTGDNGPWLVQGKSGGSTGLLSGRFSGYWNVGKGSTWEGGIREAGFAHWPGVITPFSRSAQVVSSMDLFPTALELAGVALPDDREYDGKSMVPLLLHDKPSAHELCVPPPALHCPPPSFGCSANGEAMHISFTWHTSSSGLFHLAPDSSSTEEPREAQSPQRLGLVHLKRTGQLDPACPVASQDLARLLVALRRSIWTCHCCLTLMCARG